MVTLEVIGEQGSGKSTLIDDLIEALVETGRAIVVKTDDDDETASTGFPPRAGVHPDVVFIHERTGLHTAAEKGRKS